MGRNAIYGAGSLGTVLGAYITKNGGKVDLINRNKQHVDILNKEGAIITEYLPEEEPFRGNFLARNRIISGISKGVIVVEAAEKSGALITVDFALEQGRDVFSIPGNINSEMSKGCNKIIKEGANLLDSLDDIINIYNIKLNDAIELSKTYDHLPLDSESMKVINVIKDNGVLQIDDICDYIGMEIKYVNTILNELTLKDILVEVNNNTYSLNV